MQSQSSTTLSKVLLAPHLNSEQSRNLGQSDQYLGNSENPDSDTTLQVTEKILGAMGEEKEFWFANNGSLVIAVGSVAVLVCVVGLLWKFMRKSSGVIRAKSGSVPPPEMDTTEDEDGIYRHELGIYNSINEGSGLKKDGKSFSSSLTNMGKKDPFVIGSEYTQCKSYDTPVKTSRNRRSVSDGQGSPI